MFARVSSPPYCRFQLPLIASVLVLGPMVAMAGPRIAITPSQVDFGTVNQYALTSRTLEIRNTGDAPLEFRGVDIGKAFGFYVYQLSDEEVPPGGSTFLTIWFDSSSVFGQIEEGVEVVSNDFDHSRMPVFAKGVVQRRVRLIPAHLRLRAEDSPQKVESVLLVNAVANGFTSARVEPTIPGLCVAESNLKNHIVLAVRADWAKLSATSHEFPSELSVVLEGEGKQSERKTVSLEIIQPESGSPPAAR